MAPHSSTLAWKIPWMEEPGRLQPMGSQTVGQTERLHFHFSLSCIGEGNGNPLQCSRLENPRDGGAWWASVYGVAQSRTWLKRLSSSNSYNIYLPTLQQQICLFFCVYNYPHSWNLMWMLILLGLFKYFLPHQVMCWNDNAMPLNLVKEHA